MGNFRFAIIEFFVLLDFFIYRRQIPFRLEQPLSLQTEDGHESILGLGLGRLAQDQNRLGRSREANNLVTH